MPDTTDPQTGRPEVDDPRVLALAKARQHIAHSSPFNFVCPPWDGLDAQERQLSLLAARNYLHAALDAGLVPAAPPAPADRAGLRDLIRRAVCEAEGFAWDSDMLEPDEYGDHADLMLSVLPPVADRGAVLREAADAIDRKDAEQGFPEDGVGWATAELRRMADAATPVAPPTPPANEPTPSVAAPRTPNAEALLLHFTAEAHRRKWSYDRGLDDDGVPLKSEAFDALHRLGDEMNAALHKLRRLAAETPGPETQGDEVALLRLTVDAVEEGRRELRAENARLRAQLWTLGVALDGLHTLIATSSRDWGQYRVDAWLWAVLVGWDCEEQHEHDELCDNGAAMAEMQRMHGWNDEAVAKARRYRAAVRAITAPAAVAEPGKECAASVSGNCLAEAQSETGCATEDGECVHAGQPSKEA